MLRNTLKSTSIDIKRIVEKSDTRAGRLFDLAIQSLIILSLITFSISTIPDLGGTALQALFVVQVCTVTVFSLEYILRIAVANDKLGYIFSFYGIIDLLAILPFYLSAAVDLRSIRILRLFRLFRVFKVVRYSKAIKRYRKAFADLKEELIIFLMATFFIIYISSVGIYYFEHAAQPEQFKSVFHSLWWAVATLTTVGYGDVYPVTTGGKIFTFVVLMVGLSIVAIPTGLLASALQDSVKKSKEEEVG